MLQIGRSVVGETCHHRSIYYTSMQNGLTEVCVWCLAALIQQVMQLTPEQVAALPPEQQQQVQALRDAVVSADLMPLPKIQPWQLAF